MALTLEQGQQHFKVFGKMIWMAQRSPVDVAAYQKGVMGTIRQGVDDGVAAEFSLHNDVLVPMETSIKSTITSLTSVPTQIKSGIDNYLKRVVSTDVGLTSTDTANAIAAAMGSQLNDAGGSVGASGSNPTGFAVYFNTNYNSMHLPQSGSPNVLDAWIDDDVI